MLWSLVEQFPWRRASTVHTTSQPAAEGVCWTACDVQQTPLRLGNTAGLPAVSNQWTYLAQWERGNRSVTGLEWQESQHSSHWAVLWGKNEVYISLFTVEAVLSTYRAVYCVYICFWCLWSGRGLISKILAHLLVYSALEPQLLLFSIILDNSALFHCLVIEESCVWNIV